ncbi:hypothetical protein HPB47_022679 [Ixodes persulcatus]|uniref:Uncharacterized protein n=1 Tax=Ixodes persulcatus TaxID=34615 RepID=A0AC60Q9I0_IXOPE|nr:hypothetical protein HPB47_022679 [Ixodes persulcatus]
MEAARNLLVLSTPDPGRFDPYATLQAFMMNRNEYAISAYYPAEDHGKGVIQQVPIEDDEPTILESLMASGYKPPITEARRLGKS